MTSFNVNKTIAIHLIMIQTGYLKAHLLCLTQFFFIKRLTRARGRLLVNCVPMREQRTAKLTLNSVFDILKLIPLFTLSSPQRSNQKVTLSNVVNLNAYFLISATFCKICKNIPFSYKISIFPTLNDDSATHRPARKKYPFSSFFFLITHRYTTDQQAPPPPPPPGTRG